MSRSPAGEQRVRDAVEVQVPANLDHRIQRLERYELDLAGMISLGWDLGMLLFPEPARRLLDNSNILMRAVRDRTAVFT